MAKKKQKKPTLQIFTHLQQQILCVKKVGYYYKELLTEIWKFKLLKKAII